jgi:replicative superfamily II helicase
VIESRLEKSLIDHINAEIVVGSMSTWESCLEWLKSTFLFTRMCRDPNKYFKDNLTVPQIEDRLTAVAHQHLQELEEAEMLRYTDAHRRVFQATQLACITARWYLSFKTAKLFTTIGPRTTFEDYLDIFASSDEFGQTDLRIKVSA